MADEEQLFTEELFSLYIEVIHMYMYVNTKLTSERKLNEILEMFKEFWTEPEKDKRRLTVVSVFKVCIFLNGN